MLDIQEEGFVDKSPIPVSIKKTEKILNQMKKSVCKIKRKEIKGTGFFAKLPYRSKYKKVLITCEHILKEEDIINSNIITISINNEEQYKEINLGINRLKFTDKSLDITIIEIKEEDKIEEDNYIELDERYNLGQVRERYQKESLYILNYPKGEDIVVSYGLAKDISDKEIFHTCSTEEGSSGSPILSLKSLNLIGIHKGNCIKRNFNKGIFIKYVIDEFNKIDENSIKNNKINEANKINNEILNIEKNKLNEMTIIYKISKYDYQIRIFGFKFVENNKNNCKIIIEGKEEELKEYLDINENLKNNLEIKLKEIQPITDMSYMFYYCNNLISLPDISEWDTKNVTNISFMFDNCNNLSSLSDISKWNTKNISNMRCMFYNCNNLESLPDISKWDTKNVSDMEYMFNKCNKLSPLLLPNFYKEYMNNV